MGHSGTENASNGSYTLWGYGGVAPGPDTSKPHPEHRTYPYPLRGLAIERVNQVWSTEVTFIPMPKGFMYLVAVIDWYSRYVILLKKWS
jgi:putative transposase